jgi:hypothetical protein
VDREAGWDEDEEEEVELVASCIEDDKASKEVGSEDEELLAGEKQKAEELTELGDDIVVKLPATQRS